MLLIALGVLLSFALIVWLEHSLTARLDGLSERIAILEGRATRSFPYDVTCPTCDALPGTRCTGSPAAAHGARYEADRSETLTDLEREALTEIGEPGAGPVPDHVFEKLEARGWGCWQIENGPGRERVWKVTRAGARALELDTLAKARGNRR